MLWIYNNKFLKIFAKRIEFFFAIPVTKVSLLEVQPVSIFYDLPTYSYTSDVDNICYFILTTTTTTKYFLLRPLLPRL